MKHNRKEKKKKTKPKSGLLYIYPIPSLCKCWQCDSILYILCEKQQIKHETKNKNTRNSANDLIQGLYSLYESFCDMSIETLKTALINCTAKKVLKPSSFQEPKTNALQIVVCFRFFCVNVVRS